MRLPRAPLPRVALVQQSFASDRIADVPAAVRAELERSGALARVRPGETVAITAGSRGIASIAAMLKTVADVLKDAGAAPFIVPAMGSHGGATAEGQVEVLRSCGITEQTVGVPIRASMEVETLGQTASGATVSMDRLAFQADSTLVVGRVKPHTAFRGPIESGLCKMLTVGLGKQRGAESLHASGLAESIPQAAELLLARTNILLGLAIVENADHQTFRVEAVLPRDFLEADRRLLRLATELLPRVPFDRLDVLVVGLIGKNISGSGMDYNVIGMWRRLGGEPRPDFRRIVVLDLTPESEGNGVGVGIADFTTRRLVEAIDWPRTYLNALTSGALQAVKMPIVLDDEREALEVAVKTTGCEAPRLALIRSTLDLTECWVSEALLPEVQQQPRLAVVSPPRELPFDRQGNLDRASLGWT